MKKVVLKLDIHDDRQKKKAMEAVCHQGIESISIDMKENKLTLTGDVDLVSIVNKLRKITWVDIDSVGPAKVEEEKKKEPKKEPKKEGGGGDKKKAAADPTAEMNKQFAEKMKAYRDYYPYHYNNAQYVVRSWEENPNSCVIC